jgi:hypothetical protein
VKTLLVILAAIIVFAGECLAFPAASASSDVYDFGNIPRTGSVSGVILLTNIGDSTLLFDKPIPSCGCTDAILQPTNLASGQIATLSFTIKLENVSGLLEKEIFVLSNDPKRKMQTFKVRANVNEVFRVNPTVVFFSDLPPERETNIVVLVKRGVGILNITRLHTESSHMRAFSQRIDDSSADVWLDITNSGTDYSFGSIDSVEVFTDDNNHPSFRIPVIGSLSGALISKPNYIFWGLADTNAWLAAKKVMRVRKINIISSTGKAVQLGIPRCNLPNVLLEMRPIIPGVNYELKATLSAPPVESSEGVIEIPMDLPNKNTFRIPITIKIASKL